MQMMPTKTLDILIEPSPQAASEARRSLDEIEGLPSPEKQDHLRLLTTELVTNSVRHTGLALHEHIRLGIMEGAGLILVEVTDFGKGFERPIALAPGSEATSGWGLYMVELLAERWGIECDGGLTLVWFELAF